jgi:hypothetical protein
MLNNEYLNHYIWSKHEKLGLFLVKKVNIVVLGVDDASSGHDRFGS